MAPIIISEPAINNEPPTAKNPKLMVDSESQQRNDTITKDRQREEEEDELPPPPLEPCVKDTVTERKNPNTR